MLLVQPSARSLSLARTRSGKGACSGAFCPGHIRHLLPQIDSGASIEIIQQDRDGEPAGRRTCETRPLPGPGRSDRQRRWVPGTLDPGRQIVSQDIPNGVSRIGGQAGTQRPLTLPRARTKPGTQGRGPYPHSPCRIGYPASGRETYTVLQHYARLDAVRFQFTATEPRSAGNEGPGGITA